MMYMSRLQWTHYRPVLDVDGLEHAIMQLVYGDTNVKRFYFGVPQLFATHSA